jgi:hypothetical protein
MLKVGRALKPDRIVMLGDYLDAYCVSSHGGKTQDRAALLVDEVADANKGLDEIERLGAKRVDFLFGNHTDRIRRYIADKAPELFGIVTAEQLFRLKERGWHWKPYREALKIGAMSFVHDVGKSGAGAAAKTRDIFGGNACIGHVHRNEMSYVGNLKGETHVGASFGWLGDRSKVDYMASPAVAREWTHGVGIAHHDTRTGVVYLTSVPFVNWTALVNGKVIRG